MGVKIEVKHNILFSCHIIFCIILKQFTQMSLLRSSWLFFFFMGGKKCIMQINTSKTEKMVCQTPSNDLLCSKVHCGTTPVDARPSPDGSSGSYYTAFFSAAPPPDYLTAPALPRLLSLSAYLSVYARRQFPGWVKLYWDCALPTF